jgi:hypothetical protein
MPKFAAYRNEPNRVLRKSCGLLAKAKKEGLKRD